MTNTLPIREPNMMKKYAILLKTCSVSESGSYVHCGDAELEFVALSLEVVVIFGKESAIDKMKERRFSQKLTVLWYCMLNSDFGGTTGVYLRKVKYFFAFLGSLEKK